MIRSPLAAAAVLAAGLLLAACGAAPVSTGHAPRSGPPTPSASAKPGAKATPTPTTTKPLSADAAAEAGFRAWAQATVILTGPQPISSMPKSEADILVVRKAFYFPGWQTSLGMGNVLVETPPGCMASVLHVTGAFPVPANAPVVAGASKTALVVYGRGACHTEAGGQVFMNVAASAPGGTVVLLGSLVPLPPVPALPSLPTEVWTPMYEGTCASGWVVYAGSNLPGGVVPGC